MKRTIIFDAQILQTPARERGMGQYVVALLKAMHQELAKTVDVEMILMLTSKINTTEGMIGQLQADLPGVRIATLPLTSLNHDKNTKLAMRHNKHVLDSWIAEEGLQDATFIMGSVFQVEIYPVFPEQTRNAAICYDVIPLQLFEQYKNKMRWEDYLLRFRQVYTADMLLCISKTIADDFQVYANVLPHKLEVIDGGPGLFDKIVEPAHIPNQKYILMPTGNDVRKNNRTAIIGFEEFRQTHPDYTLLITSSFTEEERNDLMSLSNGVVFTGSISNEELAWYYKNCEAMLFPSLYEGLGMPIIEAMEFDKPVVASNISVFAEISLDAPFYFNPWDPLSIAGALTAAIDDGTFVERRKNYKGIADYYTWENTAKKLLDATDKLKPKDIKVKRPKLAIAGPYSSGASAIGKFMAVLHPALQEFFDIEYFFESSSVDVELRPDILSYVAPAHHISELTDGRIKDFDLVIYQIGNSNHHTLTAARALVHPGIIVLHDLNLENIFKAFLERRMIDARRFELEERLNGDGKTRFATSLLTRQRGIITHSNYAKDAVGTTISGGEATKIRLANLCVPTPQFYIPKAEEVFTIGLAGILANIKGLEVIEEIAKDPAFAHDKVLLFGLNFAEKGALERLRLLPNVEVATDLTDYQFQQNLKRMSVFVNYRTHYQGEASYSTLETMRYGIPVIVRGDFGWYSELPGDSAIKVEDKQQLIDEIKKLKSDPEWYAQVSAAAREATSKHYSPLAYADELHRLATDLIGENK